MEQIEHRSPHFHQIFGNESDISSHIAVVIRGLGTQGLEEITISIYLTLERFVLGIKLQNHIKLNS